MVKMKDIAEKANVSISTVSRVLNYDPSISVTDETRKRIFEIAQELNYKTLRQRNGKSAKESYRIGLVSWYSDREEMLDPYYMAIRLGVEKECFQHGIDLTKLFVDSNEGTQDLSGKPLDGLIAIGRFEKEDLKQFPDQIAHIVFVDSSPDEQHYDSVVIDLERAVAEIINYLIERGHTRIGYIGGKNEVNNRPVQDEREKAFIEQLASLGLYNPEYVFTSKHLYAEDGYQLMHKAIQSNQLPSAFFVENDSMAIGALRAMHEANLKVPQDVSIIGFNDIATSAFLQPSLTTMKVHMEYMGETAVELLLERMMMKRTIAKKVVLATQLVERESTSVNLNEK